MVLCSFRMIEDVASCSPSQALRGQLSHRESQGKSALSLRERRRPQTAERAFLPYYTQNKNE